MKIRPENLIEKDYVLIDSLEHKELPIFLKKYLNKRTKTSILFYGINIILIIIPVLLFFIDDKNQNLSILDWFFHYFIGFSIAFLLVPLHEYIHVLAYKSQGATNTSYAANLKKFYFMALADKFVASKKEFKIVALAPFTIITTTLIILLFMVSSTWILTILGILLCHTAMSSGDFALLSYFEYHKEKEVVTYDDVTSKISYFYGRTEDRKTTA